MNKSELELRSLIDIAFVVQDYETVINNAEYPITDFKKIQAHKNKAHCEEIMMFSKMAFDKYYLTRGFKEFLNFADTIFETYHKKATTPIVAITKFTIFMTEIL